MWREDALFWDRPRVVYHRVYFSIRRLTSEGIPESHVTWSGSRRGFSFFFFVTLKPRVEWYTKSMSLKYEVASEPLHIPPVLISPVVDLKVY